uniref:Peptidyl-prolyl cis-trans isomerase FKBP18, chloroplastic n=1 Tax=Noccaea caerulescens TaxID=107243 RepID=A0A1J3H896_NOCCA
MAAISSIHRWASDHHSRLPRISSVSEADQSRPTNQTVTFSFPISRRVANIILLGSIPLTSFFVIPPSSSDARERRSRKVIPLEKYSTSPEGLQYYDIEEGKGPVATKGSTAQVHFDCRYRSITAISTRESKLCLNLKNLHNFQLYFFSLMMACVSSGTGTALRVQGGIYARKGKET